jgi:hypothetical protein
MTQEAIDRLVRAAEGYVPLTIQLQHCLRVVPNSIQCAFSLTVAALLVLWHPLVTAMPKQGQSFVDCSSTTVSSIRLHVTLTEVRPAVLLLTAGRRLAS